jgi:hypothetical protein
MAESPAPRRPVLPAAVATLALVAVGCSGGDRRARGDPAADQLVSPDEVHVVGASDAIVRIADVQPTSDGTLWVLNSSAPFFLAFGPDGRLLRSHGARGEGPGEFRTPNVLLGRSASNEVWTYDRGAQALYRISAPGDSATALPLPRDSLAADRIVAIDNLGTGTGRAWIRLTADGFLVARSRGATSGVGRLWQTDLVELRPDGSLRRVFSPANAVGERPDHLASAEQLSPFPMWARCPDGSVAVYDPVRNALRRFTAEGVERAAQALPPERRLENSPERLFSLAYVSMVELSGPGPAPDTSQFRAMLRDGWDELSRTMAPLLPEYGDLHCAGRNVVWIQPVDAGTGRMGRGPAWLRIDEDGTLQRVILPERFRPLRFTEDRIWGSHRGEFDVESPAWIAWH